MSSMIKKKNKKAKIAKISFPIFPRKPTLVADHTYLKKTESTCCAFKYITI